MTSNGISRAIILAAGSGERLKPLTLSSPKCLLPIGTNNNFLNQTITCFLEIGVKDFTIVVGYLKENIKQYIANTFPNIEVHFIDNTDFRTTNSGYSLWLALQQNNDAFYFQDADLYCPLAVYQSLQNSPNNNALLVDTDLNRLNAEAMKVLVRNNHNVLNLNKNIAIQDAAGEFIGLGSFSSAWANSLLQTMDHNFSLGKPSNLYYEDVMNQILPDLPPVMALSTDGLAWIEVDTPEDYEELRLMTNL